MPSGSSNRQNSFRSGRRSRCESGSSCISGYGACRYLTHTGGLWSSRCFPFRPNSRRSSPLSSTGSSTTCPYCPNKSRFRSRNRIELGRSSRGGSGPGTHFRWRSYSRIRNGRSASVRAQSPCSAAYTSADRSSPWCGGISRTYR